MPLSTDSLRCFVEGARQGNFRAAARAVGLSPAAYGQRIRQLEEQLDESLFHRTTRSVQLTEAGRRLLPRAEAALAALHDCERAVRGELAPAPIDIVLGTRHELGLSWLVPMRRSLMDARPGLTIHMYFGSGEDLLLRVRSSEIDCAVTSTRLTDPKLVGFKLHEETYAFVGAPELLRRRPLRRAGDAANHTLVDTGGDLALFRYWRDAAGGIDSLRFGRVLRMGTIAAIREMVLAGEGIAVLPHYYVASDLRARRLRRVLPRVAPLPDFFRLVFRADDPRRDIYAGMAETMRAIPLA